ncbi:MAG: cation-translocating P-type ATPase [Usitatibacter sp.]
MPTTPPPNQRGLDTPEAARRRATDGPNSLPTRERPGVFALLRQVMREPMFLLLAATAAIYLMLGDLHESLVLSASLLVVISITVVQERRTERALEALEDLSSPRALVIRDGVQVRIAGPDVVRGDILVLREGDRVAADARLLECHDLMLDESLLTGESVPLEKNGAGDEPGARVFSGTLVVRGSGFGEVVATGVRSEIGRIGASLARAQPGRTRLEEETMRMVRLIAVLALALCVLSAILHYALRGGAVASVLSGLTLAMALLPEEFPVVLTVFLAIGAWRISRHGVLTRRLPAVEMLGATTVLCCDKTGTLTENHMTLVEAWAGGRWHDAATSDPDVRALVATAVLACEPQAFDPMERAILESRDGHDSPAPGARAVLERRYPLADGFLAVAHGWEDAAGTRLAAVKGAPETVLALSAPQPEMHAEALAVAGQAAARGLRLLGVARCEWGGGPWPDSPGELPWRFLGFVALADPVRAAVPAAIAACRRAGVRVVMITGDHAGTACAIAGQAGIDNAHVLTGPEVEGMDPAALALAVSSTQVFARVRPEQKLKLVMALRAAGDIVAMTGDGVNDAPALRAAHIGIAMGKRGTDVAREAAGLVLVDDDFTAIVSTIRLGRRIYDNIRNAMRYLVAVHVPLAGMAFIPLLAGWPLFLFPVHVVFLEFVIDPACSLVFEAERDDPRAMERPPRPPAERLFNAASLAVAVLLGAGVFVAVAAVYGMALANDVGVMQARALAFATLVAGNLALIFANRSHLLTVPEILAVPNRALWAIVAGTVAAMAIAINVPVVAAIFRFEPPPLLWLGAACLAGIASVAWYDLYKLAHRASEPRA